MATFVLAVSLACGGGGLGSFETPPSAVDVPPPPATPAPAAVVTAPTTAPAKALEAGEYPGSTTGLCQRMSDCGCNPMASVTACAKAMDMEFKAARAQLELYEKMGGAGGFMEAMTGGEADDEAMRVVGEVDKLAIEESKRALDDMDAYLYTMANAECSLVCAAQAAPAPKQQGTTLVVRSVDREWLDVRVDGADAIDVRTGYEGSYALPDGTHLVEIFEFMEDEPVSRVRVVGGEADTIVIGASEDGPATCYDPTWCTVE